MARNYGLMGGFLLVCVLLLGLPGHGSAALFGKSVYSDVENAIRDADHARDKYHEHRRGRDSDRYEREWIDREHKLEQTRIERMSREAKTAPHELLKMRENGRSWKDISDRFRVDAHKMGCGHKGPHGYDRDNDRELYNHLYKSKGKGHR